MSSLVEPSRSRAVSRLALVAALSAGVAGCSSDFSRFTENPWASKPQAQAPSHEVTGSVQAAPSHRVETQALAAPAPSHAPTYGGGAGIGSYQPAPSRPEVTGSIAPPPPRQPAQNWSWNGGTAVIRDTEISYNRALGGDGADGSGGGDGFGGGAYNAAAGSLRLERGTVTENHANGGEGDAGDGEGIGGGVYNLGLFDFYALTRIFGNHASTSHDDVFSL